MLFWEESISTDSLQVLDSIFAQRDLKTHLRATDRVTGEFSTQVGWVYSQTPKVTKLMNYTA